MVGLVAVYLSVSLWIGSEVKRASEAAMKQYDGDAVEALIQCVEDEGSALRVRNRAVWALGQWGDPRALAILKQHMTRQTCDHEHDLCQHEVSKAVDLLKGDLNITAFVWR